MINDIFNIGKSKDTTEAVEIATKQISNPTLVVFVSSYGHFEGATKLLHEKYPLAQVIGMTGYAYSKTEAVTEYVGVWAINSGIEAKCDVMNDLDRFPMKHIKKLEQAVEQVHPGRENTICLAFMTNDQDCLTTTLNSVLMRKNVELIGATPFNSLECENPLGDKVSLNGIVYKNSCVYAVIKNLNGRVKVYKENIYQAIGKKMVVTKVNKETNEILELNGKPALKEYYSSIDEATNGTREGIIQNSICRLVGHEEFSLVTDILPKGMVCKKKLDVNDVICAEKLGDYRQVNAETKRMIDADFSKVSTIFTLDCIFRYLAFSEVNYIQTYLNTIQSIGKQVGFITGGETYKNQSMHQTMVCAVFE